MSDTGNEFGEEPAVFDTEDEAALDVATLRGLADFEAGRVISHEAIKRWFLSWGTDKPLPPPKCGE